MAGIKWMQDGRYGIMVHYLSHIMPRAGEKRRTWDEMVNGFDVSRFCSEMEQSGAGWVIFPFGQNTGYYCSENRELEKYWPGKCSCRDLMLELARELRRRRIRLIAYLPSEVDSAPKEQRKALGWDLDKEDKSEFMKRYLEIIRYWAQKLGPDLSGWWFDGCYDASGKSFTRTHEWHNGRFDYDLLRSAARAGNPEAVIAMCPGAESMEYVFAEQDYLAGEANTLAHRGDIPLPEGMQRHCLIWLDCFWMHSKSPGEIAPPRFTDRELLEFAESWWKHKGAVTWNVGIYEDGTLAEKTMAQVKRIGAFREEGT